MPASPPRQRRKDARPQELLDAALALFVERGYAATRSDDVAQRAGVSKGTLYRYYESKPELFKAVVRRWLTNLIAEAAEVVEGHRGPTPELLAELARTWWERIGRTPAAGLHRVVLAELGHFPELAQFYAEEVVAPAEALFSQAIERGIARGEFRPLPVQPVAYALMAPLVMRTLHAQAFRCGGADEADAVLQAQLDIVLHGLQRRDAG